ncbi:MAG TPA: cation diffusion facilitator family transporter [Armatimonadota bacterium]|jgi:cation diffusion facilitator family transporter
MSKSETAIRRAGEEKRWVALTSVGAAVLLTSTKLVIGISTGSLGILSEAAHSGLDFVAAAITYFAVRVSDRPADADHTYGHGKVEALSALVETLLLLITCAWIIHEAVARLLFREVHVEATPWAFGVVLMSIVIDVSRSRALMRVAKKHNSQALEADALHFSTDVWSSTVVLVGLALVKYGELTHAGAGFQRADALAALGVAAIVIQVCFNLGRRTLDVLLDKAPAGLALEIEEAVREVDGVRGVHRLRLRRVGPDIFVDLVVSVESHTQLQRSHAIAESVEGEICRLSPGADVVVHVEPEPRAGESDIERIRDVAAGLGQTVHNVVLWEHSGKTHVDLHAELPDGMELGDAHDVADAMEQAIHEALPDVSSVTIHIEPREDRQGVTEDITAHSKSVISRVEAAAAAVGGVLECHDVSVLKTAQGHRVAMHCVFDASLSVSEVHRISSQLEERVQRTVPNVIRVTTHPEPLGK